MDELLTDEEPGAGKVRLNVKSTLSVLKLLSQTESITAELIAMTTASAAWQRAGRLQEP